MTAKRERWRELQRQEQERVRATRIAAGGERWTGLRANFQPAILLMTLAIENAKRAIANLDAVECLAALQALRDFDSDD